MQAPQRMPLAAQPRPAQRPTRGGLFLTAALDLGAVALGGEALGQEIHDARGGVHRAAEAQHVAVQRAHTVLQAGGTGWEARA